MTPPVKILIIGNGFGGVYALKNLHKIFKGTKNIELSMIGEKNYFLFTPLLHEVATGGINPLNIVEPIRRVLGTYLNNFYLGKAREINLKNKTVLVDNSVVSYDYLIVASGSQPNFYNIPGADKFTFTLKSIDDAVRIKNHCILQMEKASHILDAEERRKMLKFVIVGGGPTGVELAAEMEELVKETFSHYYAKEIIKDVSILLIQGGPQLVPQFGKKIREKSLQVLRKKGVEVMLGMSVKEVGISFVLVNDKKIDTETIIWVAGVKPNNINFSENLNKTPEGKFIVNEYLQIEGYENVFAIGDNAAFKDKTKNIFLPALAQVAEKESGNVAQNIKLLLHDKPLIPFSYHSSGNLMSLGKWMAVGEIAGFSFSGHLAWWFWRTVYLSKLISLRKKVKVALDWTLTLFSPRDISRLWVEPKDK